MECCVQFGGTCSWIVYSLGEHVRGLCTVWENMFVDCVQCGRICSWIVYSLGEHVRGLCTVWKNIFVDFCQNIDLKRSVLLVFISPNNFQVSLNIQIYLKPISEKI